MSDITHFIDLDHGQGLLYIVVAVFAAVALIKALGYLFEKFGLKTGAMLHEDRQDRDIDTLKRQQDKVANDLDEIKKSISDLSSAVNTIKTDVETNEMRRKRRKILELSDKITEGRMPSKESIDDIIEQYDEYEAYISQNKLTNGRMTLAIQNIRNYYTQHYMVKEE